MIVFFQPNTSNTEMAELQLRLKQKGYDSHLVPRLEVCVVPNLKESGLLKDFSCVRTTKQVDTGYQLASLEFRKETEFQVNGVRMGSRYANLIAGPCSVESEEQIHQTARFLRKNNLRFIRGGAYKPRTSPYSFRGLGKQGLKWLQEAARENNLNVVTELMDLKLLDEVMEYADIIQVGSRNMANFYLLSELGKVNKPIMLKRGMQARIHEWLLAADYILCGGNDQVILCERGIRSFDPMSRNVMDVAAIPLVKTLSHLPVIADPSHGTGDTRLVGALAKASMVAGANGLMVEIHPEPVNAWSDARQAMSFDQFESLLAEIDLLKPLIGKPMDATFSVAI